MSYSFTKFLLCLDLRKGLFSTAVALGFMVIARAALSAFAEKEESYVADLKFCKPLDILGTLIVLFLFVLLLALILHSKRLIIIFLIGNLIYMTYCIAIMILIMQDIMCFQWTIYLDIALCVWLTYVSIMGVVLYFKETQENENQE